MNEAKTTKTVSKKRTSYKKKGNSNENFSEKSTKGAPSITSLYTSNPQLVKDAGSLAFAQSLGTALKFTSYAKTTITSNVSLPPVYLPGVALLQLRPTYGGYANPVSPLNMAARKIYSFVRHANSGRSNYESADLMLYLLQMNEIIKMYSWVKRIYGIAMLYNDKNRYYPKAIIESLGVLFDDVIKHLSDFRYGINAFAIKLNSLNIPLNMALFTESLSLFSSLYLDGEDAKAQTYVFTMSDYYKFDATGHENGGSMKLIQFKMADPSNPKQTVSQLLTLLNSTLDPILQDEDMNIMSGDILKAYGDNNMLKLQPIAEDYIIYPVYDRDILAQIENATVNYAAHLTAPAREKLRITQNNQQLQLTSYYSAENPSFTLSKLLSSRNDSPTPEEVLNMTRFALIAPVSSTSALNPASGSGFREYIHDGTSSDISPMVAGTHIIVSVDIITNRNANLVRSIAGESPVAIYPVADPSDADFALREMQYHGLTLGTNFKSFPIRPTFEMVTSVGRHEITGVVGNIQNYTLVSYEDLRKIHETALLSLFGI